MKSYDWNEIAFKDKSELKEKEYIFIAGSREISAKRIVQLLKTYITKGNVLYGLLKDDYIDGFEDQPQFKTLDKKLAFKVFEKLEGAKLPFTLDTIEYHQRDLPNLIEKLKPSKTIFINGSWSRMFHLRPEFYILSNLKIKYELISPFVDDIEAKEYLNKVNLNDNTDLEFSKSKKYSEEQIYQLLALKAKKSFATDFQTSCAIVKNSKILTLTHNEVVPFETYAMHNGSVKEKNFSPANDLTHYDTVHAEMIGLIQAQEKRIDLTNTSLFINLMPCPTCAKVLCKTGIQEIVYSVDHSDGYAVKLFEMAGKKVRRFVP